MGLKYTRVRDKSTGHEYDVLSHRVDPGKHEPVDPDRWPKTNRPRPPRHNIKGPRPARNRLGDSNGSAEHTDQSAAPENGDDATKPPRRRTPSRKTRNAG